MIYTKKHASDDQELPVCPDGINEVICIGHANLDDALLKCASRLSAWAERQGHVEESIASTFYRLQYALASPILVKSMRMKHSTQRSAVWSFSLSGELTGQ